MRLPEILNNLEPQHRKALKWFMDSAGHEVPWTRQLPDGTRLFATPKGIYKPNSSKYALSVRQTLGGRYPDREPIRRSDGSWMYLYHQEGDNPEERDREFTNRGLVACMNDRVPVGVARQLHGKPNTRYEILGLALVADWNAGFFQLEGFSSDGTCTPHALDGPLSPILHETEQTLETQPLFDPSSVEDARSKLLRAVAARRGQRRFRSMLLRIYGGRCALSGCNVEAALEAAHITPYLGPETNTPQNGILLRADLHTLWDLGLWAIEEENGQVLLSRQLMGTEYESFGGQLVHLPSEPAKRPSPAALRQHRDLLQA